MDYMEPINLKELGQVAMSTFARTLPSLATTCKLAGASFVALGAALYFGQTYLIYPAYAPPGSRTNVPTPDKHHMPHYEDLTLDTPDKLKIKAYLMIQGADRGADWQRQEAAKRPTILFLHANAGNMGHRLPFASLFYNRFKCNVLMLSYRGYGKSEGSPNEKGIRSDAQLALDYLKSHPLLESTKVVLYGQSIGGAVAAGLAADNPNRIDGLILENTFLDLTKVARFNMPIATPYILMGLLKEKWNTAQAITKIPATTPVLFLSGEMDELVPPPHMLKLFDLCTSKRKRLEKFPEGMHNDTCIDRRYWVEVQKFLNDEISELPKDAKSQNGGRYDERQVDGVVEELEDSMGAGSLAP